MYSTDASGGSHIPAPEKIERIQHALSSATLLRNMAEIFKVLCDPTRLKIVLALQECELCVADISEFTDLPQSSVSHHLKTLRQSRLVDYRRQGKMVFYSLADNHVTALVAVARDHAKETI
ncbi:MAG TPA: ArsR family transcriptional regulator [Bacteroidetes bacterium]|nr:ArsR family transcriptional regulator [Bacteroidota bacterium]